MLLLSCIVVLLGYEVRRLQDELALKESEIAELRDRLSALKKAPYVEVLNDANYTKRVLPLISKANESVLVIMYVAKYDPDDPADPANDILEALVNASERGVSVRVILEGDVSTNNETARFLSSHGVDVRYDPDGITTHSKLVVIDGEFVVLGSHNWTESALAYNHETSILLKSEKIADVYESYFESLWDTSTPIS